MQLSRSFGYDADGNKISYSDTDVAQTTVAYDHLNRVGTVTAPAPLGTTRYTYFLDGAVNSITDATGTTTFSEDRMGRVATMTDPLNASNSNLTTYGYDAVARLNYRSEAGANPAPSWALVQSGSVIHTATPGRGPQTNHRKRSIGIGVGRRTNPRVLVAAG